MIKKMDRSLVMAIAILLFLVITLEILTHGRLLETKNLLALLNQSVTTIIAGLGMIFVVSLGGTDITTGVVSALAGTLAALAASNSLLLAFPVALVVGIVFGLILGTANAIYKVPSFMASLAILIAGRSAFTWIMNSTSIFATPEMLNLDMYSYKVPILIFLIALIAFVFEYTPFGHHVKAIGENENAAVHLGINVKKIKMYAFVISAVMSAIAGVFLIARSGGASTTTGTGMEMQVMMALFIGGIPVTGGVGSKIYKLILGAPMMVLIDNGLVLSGSSGALTQGIKGLVLLLVVYLSLTLNKKSSMERVKRSEANVEAA